MTDQKCGECMWLVLADNGYSNYTVEETIASCVLNANPLLPGVTGYGAKDNALTETNSCPVYQKGDPTEIDVDGDLALEYGLPDCERYQPYFKYDNVKIAIRVMNWEKMMNWEKID